MSARVPASIFDPIKQFADDHAEPLSAIVSEALAAYLSREIRRECPRCHIGNPEGSDWCRVCGAPLSSTALEQSADEIVRLSKKQSETAHMLADSVGALREIIAKIADREDPETAAEVRRILLPDQETLIPGYNSEVSRPIAPDQVTLNQEPEET